jgi:hypothetical protein
MRLLVEARRIWRELSGLARDQLQLAVLETRLAGISLVTMIAAGVMVAVLLVSAWLGLIAAVILLLVGSGLAVGIALALGVVANLLLALLLASVIKTKSEDLRWVATLGSMQDVAEVTRLRSARHDRK